MKTLIESKGVHPNFLKQINRKGTSFRDYFLGCRELRELHNSIELLPFSGQQMFNAQAKQWFQKPGFESFMNFVWQPTHQLLNHLRQLSVILENFVFSTDLIRSQLWFFCLQNWKLKVLTFALSSPNLHSIYLLFSKTNSCCS